MGGDAIQPFPKQTAQPPPPHLPKQQQQKTPTTHNNNNILFLLLLLFQQKRIDSSAPTCFSLTEKNTFKQIPRGCCSSETFLWTPPPILWKVDTEFRPALTCMAQWALLANPSNVQPITYSTISSFSLLCLKSFYTSDNNNYFLYFIHPSGKLKLSFDRTTKNISQ